jgi:hypothetical protein
MRAEEARMRHTAIKATGTVSIPRGWVVLSAAVTSWVLLIALATGANQVLGLF